MTKIDCKCGNAARYINERGELCCAICPLKESIDSIKLADVPKLLQWARGYLDDANFDSDELRSIVQRRPIVSVKTTSYAIRGESPERTTPCSKNPRCYLPDGHAPNSQSGGCSLRELTGDSW